MNTKTLISNLAGLFLIACQSSHPQSGIQATNTTQSATQSKPKNEKLSDTEATKVWCAVLGYKDNTKEMNDCISGNLSTLPNESDSSKQTSKGNAAHYRPPASSSNSNLSVANGLSKSGQSHYEIQVSHGEELFIINDEKYEAKTYCFNMEEGDQVLFIEGSPYGACVSAKLLNLRTEKFCEVWCE